MDDLSRLIGSLESQVKENRRLHDNHNSMLEKLDSTMVRLCTTFESHIKEEEQYQKKVDYLSNVVSTHDELLREAKSSGALEDMTEHHAFVKGLISREKERAEFWKSLKMKLAGKGFIALMIFLTGIFITGFSQAIKEYVTKLAGS